MLRERVLEAIETVYRMVYEDICTIDSPYVSSTRTIAVPHYSVRGEGNFYIFVTATTDSQAGDCALITLERSDNGKAVSDLHGLHKLLVDKIL
jgi:hypothetical protein